MDLSERARTASCPGRGAGTGGADFIEFGEDGLGSLGFIAVTGDLHCRAADRDGQPGAEFSWQGSDEDDDASGRGWAALNPTARSRATSTSTSATIPRSAPSGSTKPSGERPRRSRDGESASLPPNVAKYR
jgi:hypothetical protein